MLCLGLKLESRSRGKQEKLTFAGESGIKNNTNKVLLQENLHMMRAIKMIG